MSAENELEHSSYTKGNVTEQGPRSGASRHLDTIAVHAGEPRADAQDTVAMPIYRSSTYVLGEPERFEDIRYIRLNNTPNQLSVEEKLAALEKAEAALVTASGTAAIALTLEAQLRPGDHVLAPMQVYGGTRKLLEAYRRQRGIDVSYVAFEDPTSWASEVREQTKLFYLESITNPWLRVGPLDEAVAFAREHGLLTVVDNTLASPVNFRPAEMGFDFTIHSASKYLNGHTDVVAGVVAGSAEHVREVRLHANLVGACLDPQACYMLQRGLKTLPLRVRAQNEGAAALARMLDAHEAVARVHHASLPDDPSHARSKKWFDGHGAVVTFVPHGDMHFSERVLEALRIPQVAPSLGGTETLICRPATTSHAGLPSGVRREMGVPDEMIRVSVGIENPDDLIADFAQALAAAAK